MATDYTSTIQGYYQAVQFRPAPAADLAVYNASLQSGSLTTAQVQSAIINDPYTINVVNPVIREYQAAFGRVPDQAGLQYWTQQVAANPNALNTLATTFANSAEFQARFGANASTPSNVALVSTIYQQVYNRAPDAAGLQYWSTGFPKDAAGNPVPGAQPLNAAQLLNAFANAQEFVTATAPAITAYEQAELAGTAPTSGSLFNLGGNVNVGTTFTLTPNVDGPGALAPALNTNGTAQNDTYNASDATLQSSDVIDAGAGTDLLALRVVTGGTTLAPVLTNLENITVTNISGATETLNLASSTGVTAISEKGSTAASTTAYTNVGSTVGLTLDAAKGAEAFSISGAASRTGSADVFNLAVSNGVGASGTPSQLTIGLAGGAVDNTFEVLKIATTGAASYLNIASANTALNTVTVTGNAAAATSGVTKGYGLTLTDASGFANVKTIDASGMTGTGGLNISTTLAADVTFTGSAANDRLNVTAGIANINANDKLAFGAGTDTLAIGTDTAETGYTTAQIAAVNAATGLERIEFTAAGFTALKANDFTSVNAFEFSGGGTSNLAITGVETVDSYNFSASHTGTVTFTGAAVAQAANVIESGGVTLTGATSAVGATGLGGGNGGTGVTGAAAIDFGGNITTLTLNSTGTTANFITGGTGGAGGAGGAGINGGTGGAGGVAINNGASVQSVTITGDQNLTIGGGAGGAGGAAGTGVAGGVGAASTNGFSGAVSVDASAFTAKLSIQASTGNDIIKLGVASAGDSSLTGNIVRAGGGADQITLNSGVDKLDYRVATESTSGSVDTVNTFTAGQDKFVVATAVTAVRSISSTGTAGTLDTDLTTAFTGGGNFGGANNAAVVTLSGGTNAGTYLVVDTDGSNTYNAGTDLLVKLVGLSGTLSTTDFATTLS